MEGRSAVLQRQPAKRFGMKVINLRLQELLRQATPEQLDLWAERNSDPKVVEDVFEDQDGQDTTGSR